MEKQEILDRQHRAAQRIINRRIERALEDFVASKNKHDAFYRATKASQYSTLTPNSSAQFANEAIKYKGFQRYAGEVAVKAEELSMLT